jgi:hypothetical protein
VTLGMSEPAFALFVGFCLGTAFGVALLYHSHSLYRAWRDQ